MSRDFPESYHLELDQTPKTFRRDYFITDVSIDLHFHYRL